ncbi:zinc finger protein 236-like [Malaya genurostris]|uniref:zinc finger protein 236-like n=1 Tax=Malaya genurostris TaxID=325434 RepID=UPI0026F3A762|nr:zinc finger protein 236-like [Malaya genurostris]
MEDEILIVPSGTSDTFCRLCFSESNVELLVVPGVYPQPNQSLLDLVKRYINIRMPDQNSPCGICSTCRMMLEEFDRFREHCLRCNQVLTGEFGPNVQKPPSADVFCNDLPFQCEICGSGFFSKGYLDAHKVNFHGESSAGSTEHFKCMHCPRIFASSSHMRIHVRSIHESVRPHPKSTGQSGNASNVPAKRRKKRTGNIEQTVLSVPPLVPLSGRENQFAAIESEVMPNVAQTLVPQASVDDGKKPFECETCFTRFHFIGSLKRHVADSHSRIPNKNEMKNVVSSKNRVRNKLILPKPTIEPQTTIEPLPKDPELDVLLTPIYSEHQIEEPQTNEILPDMFDITESLEIKPQDLYSEEQELTVQPEVPLVSDCVVYLERMDENIIPSIPNYEIPLGKFFHSLQLKAQKGAPVEDTVEDEIKRIYPSLLKKPKKIFYCDLCQHPCHSRMVLTRHMMRHANIVFTCPDCNREFPDKSSLDRHMPLHTCEYPHPCDQCPLGFVRKGLLNKHKERYHGPDSGPLDIYYCSFCPRVFIKHQQLRAHLSIMHVSQADY